MFETEKQLNQVKKENTMNKNVFILYLDKSTKLLNQMKKLKFEEKTT